MKTETVTKQILGIVSAYCEPNVVTGLVKDLRRSDALEHRMLAGKSGGHIRRKDRDLVLEEQGKLDRLITLCQERLRMEDVCQVLLGIGDVFKVHGETHRAEELYSMVVAQDDPHRKNGVVAEAYLRRGEIYSRRAQWKQSASDLARSRAIVSELNDFEALGRVDNILGTNHAEQGKINKAIEFFERAFKQFEHTRQTQMAGVALMNLGITYNMIGEYDSAVTYYTRAKSYFENVGDVNRLSEVHHNTGMTHLSRRMFKDAIGEFNTSYMLSASLQNLSLMGLANLGKAHAYYHLRDFPMAVKLVSQAVDYATKSGDRLSLADAYKVKGMIHREMQSYDSAASYLRTSVRINTELHNQLNLAESYFEIGVLEVKRQNTDEALQAFQKARAAFKKLGAHKDVKKTMDQIVALGGTNG